MVTLFKYYDIWENYQIQQVQVWIISNVTYGCNDGSSEEEGTAHVPVAGIVGCVSNRTHSCTHGIYGVLQRARCMNYSHHNSH